MGPIVLLAIVIFGLIILGIIVAFSPTLILTQVAILTRSKRPILDSAALISGILVPIVIYGALAYLFVDQITTFQLPSPRTTIASLPFIDVLAGVLLLIAGLRLRRPRQAQRAAAEAEQPHKLMSPKALFAFGLIKMATSLSSIAAILIGVQFIESYITGNVWQAMALIGFMVISIFPFLLIASLQAYFPHVFQRVKSSSDRVAQLDWISILSWMLILAGTGFVASGLLNL